MPGDELRHLEWRKARRSMSNGACVEVAASTSRILVRDSKDPEGGFLPYPAMSWNFFVHAARNGRFDLPRS